MSVHKAKTTATVMQHVMILLVVLHAPAGKATQEMEHFVLVRTVNGYV